MDTQFSLSVVIPTYNAVGQIEPLLTRLLRLRDQLSDQLQIIVSDDASTDGTVEILGAELPGVEFVSSQTNTGFGPNCNRGAAAARHDYLAIVNSDIELLGHPFAALCDVLRRDPTVFAAMPLIYSQQLQRVENLQELLVSRGLVWNTVLPAATPWSRQLGDLLEATHDPAARLAALAAAANPVASLLCGALFVCRRVEFERLGGFSPRFAPFYWEDTDLDYRARAHSQRCVVVPQAAVLHRHSESIDKHHGNARKMHFLRLNQLRFILAHREQLRQLGLRNERWWWLLRALREVGGDRELARAYWLAAWGKDV